MLFTGVQYRLLLGECAWCDCYISAVLESTLWRNRFQYSDVAWNARRPPNITVPHMILHMAVQHSLCLTYGVSSRPPDNTSVLTC
jgi:hypothetical protein